MSDTQNEIKEIKDVEIKQRVCKHCGLCKLIECFYKTSSNGYRHRCRPCETIRRADYFKTYHKNLYVPKEKKRGRPKRIIINS